jgi:phage baseplate assembly protein W
VARTGIDRRTGRPLRGWAHVVQSLEDIFTTRKMTRVMRRLYGSDVPLYIDAPSNSETLIALRVALAEACLLWEPCFEPRHVGLVAMDASGATRVALVGTYYPNGHRGDRTPDTGPDRTVTLVRGTDSTWRAA